MERIWWKEAVAYQIYPRSFKDSNGDGIGDIQGIISKLDYLHDLGIDVIWICPVYKSPNDDNGYDISDYQEISEQFGTMADFDELLASVHARGMKLIIDLVINHTSDEHPWFVESRSSLNNPKRDWYIWRDAQPPNPDKPTEHPNNWESIFGGSAWEYDPRTNQYFLHLFSKKQPDLNWENSDVREAVYDMINWWIKKGIDGFRIDAISHIKKTKYLPDIPNPTGEKFVPSYMHHMNVPGITAYTRELDRRTFSRNSQLMTVGEANGVSSSQAYEWVGEGIGKFSMIFQFESKGLWSESDQRLDVLKLKTITTKWQKACAQSGWNANYIENHDMTRIVSSWGNDTKFWYESATSFATMYFLLHGTPFIYQGQEIGMTNVRYETIDEYNCVNTKNIYAERIARGESEKDVMEFIWKNSRDNTRTPMQWDDSAHAGFSTHTPWIGINPNFTKINVAQQQNDPSSILSFYKKLIALRKNSDLFAYGTYDLILERNESIFGYTRTFGDEKALVICNLTREYTIYRQHKIRPSHEQLVLSNYNVRYHTNKSVLELHPYETRVYIIHAKKR
jgi:alpha-glucosidase